jgi:hypothetical protein
MGELIQSDWQSNPAMKALISDYANYHTIFVVAASIALLALVSMSIFFWMKSRKISRTGTSGEIFERRVFRSFAFLISLVSLVFTLLIAVNATNAFSPSNALHGFSLLAEESAPRGDSAVGRALIGWIESSTVQPPLLIMQKIHDRLSWQRPKAIICGVLLILFVALSERLWGSLLKRKKAIKPNGRIGDTTLFVAGTTTVALALLMLIMVIANTQATLAPLTITVLVAGANG